MTNKRTHDEYKARQLLQNHGIQATQHDKIRFNHGSETLEHYLCKCIAGWVLRDMGYRVDSEVTFPDGEADLLGYARSSDPNDLIVVECESYPSDEVIKRKLGQFVENTPVRECFVLPVEDMPDSMDAALGWVTRQL